MADRRPVGASTITQQVAKNFLLSNEVTLERKIKEALLAFRMEQAFTKDQILELYLNQIYLGIGSYGVAAAALNYFDKSLDELTTARGGVPGRPAQGAFLVRPRAPARGRQGAARLGDRTHARRSAPSTAPRPSRRARSRWSCASARRPRWSAPTTSPRRCAASWSRSTARRSSTRAACRSAPRSRRTLQAIADQALRDGLIDYDRRHGWRGPAAHTTLHEDQAWPAHLAEMDRSAGLDSWQLALVTTVDAAGRHDRSCRTAARRLCRSPSWPGRARSTPRATRARRSSGPIRWSRQAT